MAIFTQLVDGTQDLSAQERALNFIEQASFAKIISYAKSEDGAPAGTSPNVAVVQEVPIGQQPGPLHLESLALGADATSVITAQLALKKIVIFHDIAFVSGAPKLVIGFR